MLMGSTAPAISLVVSGQMQSLCKLSLLWRPGGVVPRTPHLIEAAEGSERICFLDKHFSNVVGGTSPCAEVCHSQSAFCNRDEPRCTVELHRCSELPVASMESSSLNALTLDATPPCRVCISTTAQQTLARGSGWIQQPLIFAEGSDASHSTFVSRL